MAKPKFRQNYRNSIPVLGEKKVLTAEQSENVGILSQLDGVLFLKFRTSNRFYAYEEAATEIKALTDAYAADPAMSIGSWLAKSGLYKRGQEFTHEMVAK